MSSFAFDLFWLLLPVAAGSGWWAAHRGRHGWFSRGRSKSFTPDYFRGLDYVLTDQPDRAIEVFIRTLETDSEATENCLMLGKLFRRCGELDRAIRIHQSLLARRSLYPEQRLVVQQALGEDYLRSGLLDRAENLFKEMIEVPGRHVPQVLQSLLDIYQQEHEWEKAIHYGHRLAHCADSGIEPTLAHFYCEQAEVYYGMGQTQSARECLQRALSIDKRCVRVNLIQARIFSEKNEWESALKAYLWVESQDADYLPEIAAPLLDCYTRLGRRGECREYLLASYKRHSHLRLLELLAGLIAESEDKAAALRLLSLELKQKPSAAAMELLLAYTATDAEGSDGEGLRVLRELAARLADQGRAYKCARCGFVMVMLHWRCLGCKQWGTIKPLLHESGAV